MGAFEQLTTREQKLATVIAHGDSLKTAAAETGFPYSTVRNWVSNSQDRNDALIEAIAELRKETALQFKGIGTLIAQRARKEIANGEARDAAAFAKVYTEFLKVCPIESSSNSKPSAKIGNIVQHFYK